MPVECGLLMNTPLSPRSSRQGFTLVELLVVITIVVLLIALLLPALQRVLVQSKSASCRSNLRQLAIAFAAYSTDHRGRLIGTETGYNPHDWVQSDYHYVNNSHELPEAITEGALWPYIGVMDAYLSPQDPVDLHIRSYSLSGFIGEEGEVWWGTPHVITYSQIINAGMTILAVCESDDREYNIGSWVINPDVPDWVDPIAPWDPGGFNITYVDGRVEHYPYRANRKTIETLFVGHNVWYPGPDYDYFQKRLFPHID